MKEKILTAIRNIAWFFAGMSVIMTDEDDPEMWDNPRKRERIRKEWH